MYYDLVSLGIILVGATQIPDPGHGSYENFDSQRSNSSNVYPFSYTIRLSVRAALLLSGVNVPDYV
jgi:hypothetical protein